MTYGSNENYIFISYSHKDAPKVSKYIDALQKNGFRVWYDAGIEAGSEWPEYIEEHLKNSAAVLVFMTPNTVESRNCRNEINFALELEKEMLIVYLEETELLKGMRLQLNSTQSLLRKNHPSDDTFIHELINARMLQCCRGEAQTTDSASPKSTENNEQAVSRISMINAIGSQNKNEFWPKGTYSSTINRDEFSCIAFHINLLEPFGFEGRVLNKYKIYNSDNNLIFDDVKPLDVKESYDRVAFCWVVKGTDGSVIPSGDYRFVCSINNSPEFTYHVTVTSNEDLVEKTPASEKTSFFSKLKKLFEN